MASTSTSAHFHARFRQLKQEIASCLSSLEAEQLSAASKTLQETRRELATISPFLPAYDQRSYDLQLRELEQQVSAARQKGKPKSRFAFGKPSTGGAAASSALSSDSASSSRSTSVTPTPPDYSSVRDVAGRDILPEPSPGGSPGNSQASTDLISDRTACHIRLHASPDGQGGSVVSLQNLASCTIDLRPPSRLPSGGTSTLEDGPQRRLMSLHAKHLRRCVLLAPLMDGSAILDDVEDCLLVLGAQQFRIHTSHRTAILLHVPSNPIIEHSSSLYFGPFPSFLPVSPGTTSTVSRHSEVQDFDWVRSSRSPNWVELGQTASEMLFTREDADALEVLSCIARSEAEERDLVEELVNRLTGAIADLGVISRSASDQVDSDPLTDDA